MIPLFPTQLLAQNVNWTNNDGTPVTAFYFLIQALFNRTGMDNGISLTVGSALAAAGSGQADALVLMDDFNEITSGAGGVMLDSLHPGQFQLVFNGLMSSLNVYPPSHGQIDALGLNAPYSLGNGKSQIFWCPSLLPGSGAPQYRSLQLG